MRYAPSADATAVVSTIVKNAVYTSYSISQPLIFKKIVHHVEPAEAQD